MGDKYSSIVISIVPPLRTSRYSFNRILNPISRLKFAKGSEESPLSDPRRILKARQGGEEAVRVARLINGRVVHDRLHARNEAFFSEWKGRQNAGKASFARQRRSKRVKRLAPVKFHLRPPPSSNPFRSDSNEFTRPECNDHCILPIAFPSNFHSFFHRVFLSIRFLGHPFSPNFRRCFEKIKKGYVA